MSKYIFHKNSTGSNLETLENSHGKLIWSKSYTDIIFFLNIGVRTYVVSIFKI